MSNKLTFELVQPSEFEDYYYKVSFEDMFTCYLTFPKNEINGFHKIGKVEIYLIAHS